MRRVNLCDIGDVLSFATTKGHDWNGTIDLFQKARIIPFYEKESVDVYLSDMINDAYGYGEEVCNIFIGFMQSKNVTEFTMTE